MIFGADVSDKTPTPTNDVFLSPVSHYTSLVSQMNSGRKSTSTDTLPHALEAPLPAKLPQLNVYYRVFLIDLL